MAHDTDCNAAPQLLLAETKFQFAEHAFCFYFTLELMIRFLSFAEKKFCTKDGWFMFDSFLVATMIFETWVMTLYTASLAGDMTGGANGSFLRIIRLVRLTRMARMVRILRSFPELIILIRGIRVAS